MIHELFPTKILVKDFDRSKEWTDEVKSIVKAIFSREEAKGKDFVSITDDSLPLFTEENEQSFPVLTEIKQMFIDGFYELATDSTEYNKHVNICQLSLEDIKRKVSKETGRLPFMKTGQHKRVHNHLGSQAFGILYLDDINNNEEGGELVLRDPSFNSNMGFVGKDKETIQTRRNRLIIAPAHVWHEVTQFTGDERTAIVINLNVYNNDV
jgi:Rps23 Pro-64 3,4-dihydroxylase Tpa1-like proline 4-hydroxylase